MRFRFTYLFFMVKSLRNFCILEHSDHVNIFCLKKEKKKGSKH